MIEDNKPTREEIVSCEICLKEIPVSEAASTEGADYFLYFCGTECFAKWEEQERLAMRVPQTSYPYSADNSK
jgi:hypothetical protein